MSHIVYKIETERETDGRWIAEIVEVPGVMAYGATEKEAMESAQALALRVLADRIEARERTYRDSYRFYRSCVTVSR